MDKSKQSRRTFIIKAGAAAAGMAGLPLLATACKARTPANAANSPAPGQAPLQRKKPESATVILAKSPAVWDGKNINQQKLQELLFKSVRSLSGQDTDAKAWSAYFKPSDVVGIKVNTIAGRGLSTTPELVAGIIAGLGLAGIKDGSIWVWDRTESELRSAGFKLSNGPEAVRFIGTDNPAVDYDSELSEYGEVTTRVSRIASTFCTSLINAPLVKDHDLTGISCALKNYFGAINNPNKLHDNGCDPTVADNYSLPMLGAKTRLCICDATTVQYHGGPGHKPGYCEQFGGVLVSDDPVALDTMAESIIAKFRKEKKLPTLTAEDRPPKFLITAAAEPRFLGVADKSKIKIVEITA